MIIEFYPSPSKFHLMVKKKKENTDNVILLDPPASKVAGPTTFSPWQYQQAQRKKISVEEFVRRNNIVLQEAGKCNFATGQVVYPCFLDKYEDYGACKILGIANSYADMNEAADSWPSTDLPMVVHAVPLKPGKHPINATAKFFQTTPPTK